MMGGVMLGDVMMDGVMLGDVMMDGVMLGDVMIGVGVMMDGGHGRWVPLFSVILKVIF